MCFYPFKMNYVQQRHSAWLFQTVLLLKILFFRLIPVWHLSHVAWVTLHRVFFFWPFTAGGILLSHQFHITFSNIFKDLLFFFLPIGNFINLGTLNINKTPLYLVFFSFLITSGLGFGRISGAANYRSTLVFLFLFYHISANLVFSYPQCCIR